MSLPLYQGYDYSKKVGEIIVDEGIVNDLRHGVRYELSVSYNSETLKPEGFTLVPIPHGNPIS